MIGRLAVGVLIIVLAAYGIFISRHADEGEALYPLRVLGEQAELALTPAVEGKVEIKLDQLASSNTRLRENVNNDQIDRVLDNSEKFEQKNNEIKENIKQVEQDGKKSDGLKQELKAVVDNHLCVLAEALAKATPEQQEKIKKQIVALTQN